MYAGEIGVSDVKVIKESRIERSRNTRSMCGSSVASKSAKATEKGERKGAIVGGKRRISCSGEIGAVGFAECLGDAQL